MRSSKRKRSAWVAVPYIHLTTVRIEGLCIGNCPRNKLSPKWARSALLAPSAMIMTNTPNIHINISAVNSMQLISYDNSHACEHTLMIKDRQRTRKEYRLEENNTHCRELSQKEWQTWHVKRPFSAPILSDQRDLSRHGKGYFIYYATGKEEDNERRTRGIVKTRSTAREHCFRVRLDPYVCFSGFLIFTSLRDQLEPEPGAMTYWGSLSSSKSFQRSRVGHFLLHPPAHFTRKKIATDYWKQVEDIIPRTTSYNG